MEEGTAKVGKDFTHSSANLIQFDPGACHFKPAFPFTFYFFTLRIHSLCALSLCLGVSVKMWNIYLKDDGLEENHEKFDVILRAPKNAVLGQRNKATVEIVDPRNGTKKSPAKIL